MLIRWTLAGMFGVASQASAVDLPDQLALNGVLAGAYQCQQVSGSPNTEDACRGGLAFQPKLSYSSIGAGLFFVKLGFGLDIMF